MNDFIIFETGLMIFCKILGECINIKKESKKSICFNTAMIILLLLRLSLILIVVFDIFNIMVSAVLLVIMPEFLHDNIILQKTFRLLWVFVLYSSLLFEKSVVEETGSEFKSSELLFLMVNSYIVL